MATNDLERRERIAAHVREVLALLGVDASGDPEAAGTPERVAELALELTAGMGSEPAVAVLPDSSAGRGLVIARDLPFHSLCVHHLLPFFGRAHIGYLPGEGVVGITFAIKGRLDEPQVLVNPMSVMTPGIFRQIFEFTGSVPEQAAPSSPSSFLEPGQHYMQPGVQ